ncbi:Alpha/Beta hydrolase protein [Microdochium trichocladiopsis]|uniref:Alpha/Beta hydrolase protein n=1 Tax=Microdochium trichocladiopsis TaxID=1682393 RepID=A0A9P9BN12_9PEZI|nr:Alpha/Beta hydrolase protein [Microdochium trichocladiopsis]KAH7026471.1 Alpha/Beta hydrolase protein [Microdochium trichocladiopsis]
MARLSLALVTAVVSAAAVSAKCCTNLTVPVTVSARNGRFNLQPPENNIDVTDFILRLGKRGANYTQQVLEEIYTVSGTYNIAATYCEPAANEPGSVLQVLTHGVGFDRSYWDFPYANYNYSYVNQALAKGYSTFSYDRFGIGESYPGCDAGADPINEVQSWLEIAILEQLTTQLREGGLPGVSARFAKTVHVGHSFGSIQSYALGAARPDLSDGLVLTGFTQVPDYVAYFLYGANFVGVDTIPGLADKYAAGYLAPQNLTGVQQNFFASENFDPAVLEAAYKVGQPVTYGELLTLGAPAGVPSAFEGPVLIITGDYDIPFCGGNCTTPDSTFLDVSASLLKNSSHFETFVVPESGHGLNLEYTWPTTYGKILDFLQAQV